MGEYKKDNSKSEAMNVAIAVGLTDPQKGPLHDAAPVDKEGHGKAVSAAAQTAAITAANATGYVGGLTSGIGIVSAIMPALLSAGRHPTAYWPNTYAFISSKKTSEEADRYMAKVAEMALKRAMRKKGFTLGPFKKKDNGYGYVAHMFGKKCRDIPCVWHISNMEKPIKVMSMPYFVTGADSGPGWLGHLRIWGNMMISVDRKEKKHPELVLGESWSSLREAVYKELPKQFFSYEREGYKGAPAFFHNGKVLRFVKPSHPSHEVAKQAN